MKKTSFILALAFSLAAASTTLACDKNKDQKQTKAPGADKTNKAQAVSADEKGGARLTGSYIKQKIRRSGQITDGPNQVIVLDRETIERSGASDLKQLLIRQGVH